MRKEVIFGLHFFRCGQLTPFLLKNNVVILFLITPTVSKPNHLSLTVFFAFIESNRHFSLTSWRHKCPACVNGADESVREKRKQIGGAVTFVDETKNENSLPSEESTLVNWGCDNVLKHIRLRLSLARSQDVGLNGLLVLLVRAPVINYAPIIRL